MGLSARTTHGISKETNLDESLIKVILEDNTDLIRQSVVPSQSGEALYTLSSNVNILRDYWKAFKMINKEKF